MRRIIGGGTRNAHPLGVPVRSTSPGAMLANVDNSEIVSARLEDEIGRGVVLPQLAIDRKAQIKIVEQAQIPAAPALSATARSDKSRGSSCP